MGKLVCPSGKASLSRRRQAITMRCFCLLILPIIWQHVAKVFANLALILEEPWKSTDTDSRTGKVKTF